ncbi:rhomboid family intramembrane serine protease [Thalassobius sp. S69A]|uniref:rhomboid family intramembrane serine protease n=1 Tax=unclassified Thalassovita TaxID=2619711 RepID=UPI000C376FBA|nr:rhomboid family intramembrane serine protease [Paracoccaceae bacterium]
MFPIRDHNPSDRTPFVTYALIAVNVAVFLSYVELFDDPRALNAFFFDWSLIPARVAQGAGYETLFTTMFMHGGWMHLAGNMLFLWIFGDNMEDAFGHVGFLLFYLASGLAAAFAHVAADPGSVIPTVGASGAIAGVMGGYLLLFPKARIDILFIFFVFFRIFPVPAWAMLGVWFVLQLFSGSTVDASGGGVAYWAHAGGFLAGFVLALPYWMRQGGVGFWERTHGQPPNPESSYPLSRSSIPTVKRRRK